MSKPQKKAISYIRFSTPKQAQGNSYRRQLEAAREYCEQHNLLLDETILFDSGVSAFKGTNSTSGAMGAFIRGLETGDIPSDITLIVESLDRLSRQQVEKALRLLLEIIELGVTVVTLTDGNTYKAGLDMIQLMTSLLIMSRAHEESATKSKRIADAWEQKRAQALSTGKLMRRRAPAWLDVVDDSEGEPRHVINPEKAARVVAAFDYMARGNGRTAAMRHLNLQGILSPSGTKWSSTTLNKLITTEAVIGNYQPCKGSSSNRIPTGELIKGYFPAIVAEDTYWKVRFNKDANKGVVSERKDKISNLFTGCCTCALCGGVLRFKHGGKNAQYHYLLCRNKTEGNGCDLAAARYREVETVVLQVLARDGHNLIEVGDNRLNNTDALKAQLTDIRSQSADLLEMMLRLSASGSTAFDDKFKRLREQELQLERRIEESETALKAKHAGSGWHSQIQHLASNINDIEVRRKLSQSFKRLNITIKLGTDTLIINEAIYTRKKTPHGAIWSCDDTFFIEYLNAKGSAKYHQKASALM